MSTFMKIIEDEAKNFAFKEFVRILDNVGTSFTTVDNVLQSAQFADLIEIRRDTYFHWTFYIGDGFVLNLENPALDELTVNNVLSNQKGHLEKKSLKEIAADNPCRINNKEKQAFERKLNVLPIETIKANMEIELKNREKVYNLVSSNCEHFATKMRFGVGFSEQIELIMKLVHGMAELFAEMLVFIFKRVNKKDVQKEQKQ